VRLADGSAVKGFLVEAEGVRGAEEITGYGGWRAYMAARGYRSAPNGRSHTTPMIKSHRR